METYIRCTYCDFCTADYETMDLHNQTCITKWKHTLAATLSNISNISAGDTHESGFDTVSDPNSLHSIIYSLLKSTQSCYTLIERQNEIIAGLRKDIDRIQIYSVRKKKQNQGEVLRQIRPTRSIQDWLTSIQLPSPFPVHSFMQSGIKEFAMAVIKDYIQTWNRTECLLSSTITHLRDMTTILSPVIQFQDATASTYIWMDDSWKPFTNAEAYSILTYLYSRISHSCLQQCLLETQQSPQPENMGKMARLMELLNMDPPAKTAVECRQYICHHMKVTDGPSV